jgi:hypothetical protein
MELLTITVYELSLHNASSFINNFVENPLNHCKKTFFSLVGKELQFYQNIGMHFKNFQL